VEQFLFFLLSLSAIAFAVGVVVVKSPMKSVLSLLGSFVALALIYLLIGFQFLAAAQLLVYAGAIMVLFLFVVMLLNLSDVNAVFDSSRKVLGQKRVAIATAAAGVIGLIALFAGGSVQAREASSVIPAEGFDRIDYLAGLLFSRYMIPFQASALLLLATMIGVLVLAKRRREPAAGSQGGGQ
jgi:NADH-quinone oxidoreductase subunit J